MVDVVARLLHPSGRRFETRSRPPVRPVSRSIPVELEAGQPPAREARGADALPSGLRLALALGMCERCARHCGLWPCLGVAAATGMTTIRTYDERYSDERYYDQRGRRSGRPRHTGTRTPAWR